MGEIELAKFLRKHFGVEGDTYQDVRIAVDSLGVLPFRLSEALIHTGAIEFAHTALPEGGCKLMDTVRMVFPATVVGVVSGVSTHSRVVTVCRTPRPWEWLRSSPDFRMMCVADGDCWIVISRLAGYGRILV